MGEIVFCEGCGSDASPFCLIQQLFYCRDDLLVRFAKPLGSVKFEDDVEGTPQTICATNAS
jgi:hypothetical protein